LTRAEAIGRWLENALLVTLFAALMLLAVTQIALRNVWSAGLPWADGLIRIGVLWIAILGAVAASRDGKHIAINLAPRLLPAHWGRRVLIVVEAFTAVVAAIMAWHAWAFVRDSRAFGDVMLGDWPAWVFQAVLPIGFGLVAYRYLLRAFGRIVGEIR
jgi:TRAP-type C4-dicarboxylate transport system permease small subunit